MKSALCSLLLVLRARNYSEMLPDDLINDLKKCAASSAELVDAITNEANQEAQILAKSLVAKMDLVPREEFDALHAVLQRTREKIEHLQTELDALNEIRDRSDI